MTNKTQTKVTKRVARHRRIRARVQGTAARPRLAVFRSNTALYAQLIDDTNAHTLASADTRKTKGTLSEAAVVVGQEIAKKANAAGIESVVFDRGGFQYQGAIKALADAARAGGLKF